MSMAERHVPENAAQMELLASLGGFVREEIAAHLRRRKLWCPDELLPGGMEAIPALDEIREAARGLPEAARVALVINLLTEEGLPHFHRLIAAHMGSDDVWRRWNNIWTAEEDRHGCVLRNYVRDAGIFDMVELDKLQYAYVEAGFNPDWKGDPYRLLAYTTLQERATQMAHAETARACSRYEPTIQRILAHVSGDEARHYTFYRNVFCRVLRDDPVRALHALFSVLPALKMPGATIPGYDAMCEVLHRAGIYGPWQYRKVVMEVLTVCGIEKLTGLDALGRQLQEKIMRVPARLAKIADHLDAKAGRNRYRFAFLGGQYFTV